MVRLHSHGCRKDFVWPRSFRSSRPQSSGSALLIILGCVALLTILVTAFLITARTEFTSSNFYAKGVSTKLLSENVINLVMAQLLEGARSTDVNTSAPQAWASQPGMIRTYDAMGNPYKFFKLYSWDNMVGSGPFDETRMAEIPPNDWSTQTNVFTDLNEPVNATYPILDPGAQNNVEGFSLNLPTGFTTTTNPLPMPVKWLYVLKNGTLTVGTPTGTGAAVHITNASTTNPIIGRVAFWTDDETSKVNINTASEGIFWDQPYGNDTNEMGVHNASGAPPFGFAESIPNASEFARIPGHPATTSLSAVFGYGSNPILPDTSFSASDPNGLTWPLTVDTYTSAFGPYYSLTPRYQAGGTMGGAQYAPQTFSLPGYRLYDSVDELAFDPGRMPLTSDNNALYPAANGASPPGRSTLPALTPSVIQQRRFFLTAHSQAPEETLFGTPRISLWPLQDGTQTLVPRTAKDNLLAFCSTINGQPYYFQRAGFYQYQAESGGPVINSPTTIPSALSATEDFPGAPTSTPQTGVARNENLYAYLQALTGGATGNSNVPGFGGNFYLKYPGANDSTGTLVSDRDEILTQMFDLIRSGTNTFNTSPNVLPHYVYTPGKANAVDNPYGGPIDPGEAIPISIPSNHTHGLGRTYNFGDVSIVFFAQGMALNNGVAATKTTPAIPPLPAGTPAPAPNGNLMSIGPELPWAVAIDTNDLFTAPPYQKSPTIPGPCWLYWDTATGKYGAYVYEPTGTTTNSPALVAINPATNKPQVDSNNKYVPLVSSGGTIVTIADPQTTAVQAYVLLNPHSVVQGVPAFAPNLRVRVSNLDQMAISINGGGSTPMGFPAGSEAVVCYNNQNNATTDSMGGLLTPFNWQQPFDTWSGGLGGNVISSNTTSPNSYNNDGTNPYNYNYPLVSASVELASAAYPSAYGGEDQSEISQPLVANPPTPVQIHLLEPTNTGTTNTMTTTAVTLKIDVFDAYTDLTSSTAAPFQTFYVKIPTLTLPIPTIEMANQEGEALGGAGYNPASSSNNTVGPRIPGYVATNPSSLGFPVNSPNLVFNVVPSGTPPGSPFPIYGTYYIPGYPGLLYNNTAFGATTAEPQDPQPGVLQPLNYYWQQPWDVRSVSQRFSPWWSQSYGRVFTVPTTGRLICHGDVVRTFVLNPTPGSIDGDVRLLGANPIRSAPSGNTPVVATDDFIPLGDGNPAGYSNFPTQGPYTSVYIRQLHSMSFDNGSQLRVLLNLFPTSQAVLQAVPFVRDAWGNAINGPIGFIAPGNGGIGQTSGALFAGEEYADSTTPNVTPDLQGAFMDAASQIAGDWTLGQGPTADGPFIQKPDEGLQPPGSTVFPYYSTSIGNNALNTVNISYSPSREIASAIAFGSLPSRAMQGIPWCTLLFCPNPAANDNGQVSADLVHPGFGTAGATSLGTTNDPAYFNPPYTLPPDHLFLDLFWMPVVEPYAISEPFSTAGKVNMNYEIVPFGGYIHRSTALHAVMKATQLIAVPTNYNNQNFVKATATAPPNSGLNFGGAYPSFKAISFFYEDSTWEGGSPFDFAARYGINLSATIDDTASAFYQRFNVLHDIFRSASEICNVFLVPQTIPGLNYSPTAPAVPTNASYNSMQSWWANFKLTGDNGREDPYNQLYPRLTTKSNTFEVHMRVQVLSQSPADRGSGNFDLTAGDSIVGEYRGSAIVERYLDPNQTTLPDFATTFPVNPTGPTSTVDNYIHYRVVSTQAFSP
jgi:uncharacterized protein (TIGR02600 family)